LQKDAVPASEVQLEILKRKLKKSSSDDERRQLTQKITDLLSVRLLS
jgi:hypothetical protein